MVRFGASSLGYAVGTMIIIKLIYDLGKAMKPEKALFRAATLLGQYSLVCYIGQIALLQGLSWVLNRPRWPLGFEIVAIVVIATASLLAVCVALTLLRDRYLSVAKSYKLIFS
jgi:hypothetical protein